MESKIFDVAIIGAGAAGLTASIYASRYQLSNVLYGTLWGGEIANASVIENYPGFETITGAELTGKLLGHVQKFGGVIKADTVLNISKQNNHFVVTTLGGEETVAKTVILAMGLRRRHLGVPGEDKLAGRGVSYCATCDAAFFRDKVTIVAGGGDAALTAALHLANFSPQVYLAVRKDHFRGEPIWQEQVKSNRKIKVLFETQITEVIGESSVTAVKLDRPIDGKDILAVQGVFVEIGADPDASLGKDLGVALNEQGFIVVDENMATNVAGVFAAGDLTTADAHFDQIISAQAQAGLAARSSFYHLTKPAPVH